MKSSIRHYAILFVGCVLFHVAGTWSLPLIDRDEPRFAEASREMRERKDYVVPYFNNRYRFDKPPLTYWAQIASYNVFGENDFAARFPSTVAATLTALCIFAWGSRIGGERLGWWSAVIFTLSLQTFLHAKAAVADMWLVLFVTLAHWAGYELLGVCLTDGGERLTLNAQPRTLSGPSIGRRPTSNSEIDGTSAAPLWWWVFYASLALAFLAKGPIGWTPLLTIIAARAFDRRLRLARRFKLARGTLLILAIVSIWGVPALLRTQGEFLRIGIGRHVIGRSFGALEGHGGNSVVAYLLLMPFYFVTLFASLFPWSIKLPSAVRQLWRKRDGIDHYLLLGAAIIFCIFSLAKTKLPHYTLPAFPLLALLLARVLVSKATPFLKYCAVTAAIFFAATALVAPPLVAPLFPARALFLKSRDYLKPNMEFAAIEFNEPSLVWYFRGRVKTFMTQLDRRSVTGFMAKTGQRFAILPTAAVTEIFPERPPDWKVFSAGGFNLVKGKRVDLTLILKPE